MNRISNGRWSRVGVFSFLLLAVSTESVLGQPFPASNVALRSWLPLSSFTPLPANGAGCWGYVSPSGREYALMGLQNQLAVVEITNPSAAVVVGSVPHTPNLWCEITAYGNYVYVVNEASGGMDVVDLSNVDNGVVTLVQRVTADGLAKSHTITVNTASGYLYLNGSNLNGGRLTVMSLADPANPILVPNGFFAAAAGGIYTHDSEVVTYTSGPYAGREIAFCCDGGAGLTIADVTDKANITFLSRSTYPNLSYCHQGWLGNDRQYFYINDESDGINGTEVFDVSNLSAPVRITRYSTGLNATDHNQYIRGNFMFESDYRSGLRIFCMGDPVNPVQVGWFDTYPENDNSGYNGAWGNHPFFPSGTVIISDMDRGLFVVDVSAAEIAGALAMTYPNGRPSLVSPMGGTRIRVNLAALCGAALNATSPLLHYNTGSGYVTTALELMAPGEYDAVFPVIACPTDVTYYISAESEAGSTFLDPPAAPAAAYSAISASGVVVVATDAFETASAWTVGDPSSPDTATTGIWNRQDPEPTAAQPGDDHTPPPGTICWVTDGRAGTSVGQYDVDGGKTTLMSPSFDLAALPNTRIAYWRWYSNVGGTSPNQDIFTVDI